MSPGTKAVTEELVARKIAVYFNMGSTIAPEPILGLLRARCPMAAGSFETPEEEEREKQAAIVEDDAEDEPEHDNRPAEDVQWQNGMVTGVTARRMRVNGMLDLRGVPAAQVETLEELRLNGVALLDESNRQALDMEKAQINGSLVTVPTGMRVIIQPVLELSRASLEAMPDGQKIMVVGTVFIAPDVPPALAAEKFAELRLVGVIMMSAGVQGALLGKGDVTGASVVIPDGIQHVTRCIGNTTWTADYLERLPDNGAYLAMGDTRVPA
jgi:hypothetical protein